MNYYRFRYECATCNFATNDFDDAEEHDEDSAHDVMVVGA